MHLTEIFINYCQITPASARRIGGEIYIRYTITLFQLDVLVSSHSVVYTRKLTVFIQRYFVIRYNGHTLELSLGPIPNARAFAKRLIDIRRWYQCYYFL